MHLHSQAASKLYIKGRQSHIIQTITGVLANLSSPVCMLPSTCTMLEASRLSRLYTQYL